MNTLPIVDPTVGRIVHYIATESDAKAWNSVQSSKNAIHEGDHLAAIVVRIWSPQTVNLQVLPDGEGSYWKTSIHDGEQPGSWHWPERSEV